MTDRRADAAPARVAPEASRAPGTTSSRRDLLRMGLVGAAAGLAALLGRPLPVAAQRDGRRRSRDRGSDGDGGTSAPPATTIATSRSPALDVSNTSRQGDSIGIQGTAASPEGMAGLFVAWSVWKAVVLTLHPREDDPDHIKRSILEPEPPISGDDEGLGAVDREGN